MNYRLGTSSVVADREDPAADAQELIAQVAQGDKDAFTVLYDQAAAPVHGLVHTVVRDHAQAEEVTQEVFLEIWLEAGQFRPQRGSA